MAIFVYLKLRDFCLELATFGKQTLQNEEVQKESGKSLQKIKVHLLED